MSVRLSSALRTMLCCFVFLLPCSLWGQVADVPQRETFISWEDFATDYLLPESWTTCWRSMSTLCRSTP